MKALYLIVCLFLAQSIQAQILVLQPGAAAGKDAEIFNLQPSVNLAGDLIRSNAWTFSGDAGVVRGLFQFDLSGIPAGAYIVSAHLDLYSPNAPSIEFHSGANESILQRITSSWQEVTVTWNNQPSTTTQNQIYLAESTADYQDYLQIDVTDMMRDMIADPANSHGFLLRQRVESPFRRMAFASSDYSDDSKHPRLTIQYSTSNCTNWVMQPGAAGNDAEIFNLQPNVNFDDEHIRGNAWTFSGSEGIVRGLLQFDLSSIPADVTIDWATLSLFSPDAPSSQFHSGDNEAVLQRITESWGETTVTFNNQPSTTTQHQITLPVSTGEYQDYANLNVTQLVQDMVDDPQNSFGFMLKLKTESIYRRISFASGDASNPENWPKLELCYSESVSVRPTPAEIPFATLTPNPFTDVVEINSNLSVESLQLDIFNATGQIVYSGNVLGSGELPLSWLPENLYIFKLTDTSSGGFMVKKMIKK